MSKFNLQCVGGGLVWLACLWCLPLPSLADPLPDSLAAAIEHATSQKLEVRLARAEVGVAEARVRQAEGKAYPTVDLISDLAYTRSYDDFTGITASADIPGVGAANIDVTNRTPRYQVMPRVLLGYELFGGGRIGAELRKARLRTTAAELNQQLVRQNTALEVGRSYLRLRRRCVEWSTTKTTLKLSHDALKLSETRHADGRLSDIQLLSDRKDITEKERAVQSKELLVRSAYADYAAAITDRRDDPEDVSTACGFKTTVGEDLQSASALAGGRARMEKQEAELGAAQEQIAIEKASSNLIVSLMAEYGYVGRSDASLNNSFSDIKRRSALIGIKLTYNLFDGQVSKARVDEARAEFKRREIQRELDEARAEQATRLHQSRLDEADVAIRLAESRLELAASRRMLAEEKLKSGSGSELVWKQGLAREQEARDELEVATIDHALAEIELRYGASRHFQ